MSFITPATPAQAKVASRGAPWKGFAHHDDSPLTSAELRDEHNLGWTVRKEPTYIRSRRGFIEQVPDSFAMLRSTDDAIIAPHVGGMYEPFQNTEMLEFGDALVDHHGAHWVAGASVKGGRQVVAVLKLSHASDSILPVGLTESGDAHDPYLMLSTSHDGSSAFTGGIVLIRIACTNAIKMALKGATSTFKFRHTSSIKNRFEEARRSLDLVTAYATTYSDTMEQMMDIEASIQEIEDFINEVAVPIANPEARNADALRSRRAKLRSHILSTPTVAPDLRQTNFGIFQATTEFFEHEVDHRFRKSTGQDEGQLLSSVFGGPIERVREKALRALVPA